MYSFNQYKKCNEVISEALFKKSQYTISVVPKILALFLMGVC